MSIHERERESGNAPKRMLELAAKLSFRVILEVWLPEVIIHFKHHVLETEKQPHDLWVLALQAAESQKSPQLINISRNRGAGAGESLEGRHAGPDITREQKIRQS